MIEMNPGICSTSSCMRREVFAYASESAPSRRWVLKITTTSVGSFTLRYGKPLRSSGHPGPHGVLCSRVCPLRLSSAAIRHAVDELEPGPRFVHSAPLHIDQSVPERDRAAVVLRSVRRAPG